MLSISPWSSGIILAHLFLLFDGISVSATLAYPGSCMYKHNRALVISKAAPLANSADEFAQLFVRRCLAPGPNDSYQDPDNNTNILESMMRKDYEDIWSDIQASDFGKTLDKNTFKTTLLAAAAKAMPRSKSYLPYGYETLLNYVDLPVQKCDEELKQAHKNQGSFADGESKQLARHKPVSTRRMALDWIECLAAGKGQEYGSTGYVWYTQWLKGAAFAPAGTLSLSSKEWEQGWRSFYRMNLEMYAVLAFEKSEYLSVVGSTMVAPGLSRARAEARLASRLWLELVKNHWGKPTEKPAKGAWANKPTLEQAKKSDEDVGFASQADIDELVFVGREWGGTS